MPLFANPIQAICTFGIYPSASYGNGSLEIQVPWAFFMTIQQDELAIPTKQVCVLVPFQNAEDTLHETMTSLLNANCIDEIILINDGSTDGSSRIIQAISDDRVTLLQSSGKGISAALNSGIAASTAPYIMRCDADDLVTPTRFEKQVKFLEQNPDIGAVAGRYYIFMDDGYYVSELPLEREQIDITDELRVGTDRTHLGTFLVRREILLSIEGAREYFVSSQDLDMQYRIADVGRVVMLPDVVYGYRLRAASISHSSANARRNFYREQSRLFARQRSEHGQDDLEKNIAKPFQDDGELSQTSMDIYQRASGMMEAEAWWLLRQREHRKAVEKAFSSLRFYPTKARKWIAFLKIALAACLQRLGLR